MSPLRTALVALTLALAAPAAAQADATLSVTGVAPHKALTYTAGDALGHSVTASVVNGDLVLDHSADLAAGSACSSVDARTANCGPAADFEHVTVTFGAGGDRFAVNNVFPIDVTVDGGPGRDILETGSGDNRLSGGPGDDTLSGTYGDDELVGGDGDDELIGGNGTDKLDAGAGDDYVGAADSPPAADAAIACGSGLDSIFADGGVDPAAADCEATEAPLLAGTLSITGDPRMGSTLGLSTPSNVGGVGLVTIAWLRCDIDGYHCTEIDGADDATYVPTAADLGLRLRAVYAVENWFDDDWQVSESTRLVQAARPARPPAQPRPPRTPTTRPSTPKPPVVVIARPGRFSAAGRPTAIVLGRGTLVDTGRTVRCPVGFHNCFVTVVARVPARKGHRAVVVGRAKIRVWSGGSAKVVLELTRSGTRLLRRQHRLKLAISAVVTRSGTSDTRTAFRIAVKAPR